MNIFCKMLQNHILKAFITIQALRMHVSHSIIYKHIEVKIIYYAKFQSRHNIVVLNSLG